MMAAICVTAAWWRTPVPKAMYMSAYTLSEVQDAEAWSPVFRHCTSQQGCRVAKLVSGFVLPVSSNLFAVSVLA